MKISSIFFAGLFFLLTFSASGQDEISRVEFYGGYSYLRADVRDDDPDFPIKAINTHGVNLQLTGNVSKYVGLKFDFAGQDGKRNDTFEDVNFETKYRLYSFMGGLQIKNNVRGERRVKPFAHLLAGAANQRLDVTGSSGGESITERITFNDFSMAFGGGVDVKVSDRVDLRVIQFDYNPIFRRTRNHPEFGEMPGGTQHNFRIGVGIVIH